MSRLSVIVQHLLPQHGLSRLAARLAEGSQLKNLLIKVFIKRYGVDMSEALIEDPRQFSSFNAFFTRELKATARPIGDGTDRFLSPADGAISQLGDINQQRLLQAKGRHFTLQALLGGDAAIAREFSNGSFATIYLSPKDYHRVHMPVAGRLRKTVYIPGKLFSVNRATTAAVANLFARNERVVCLFDTGFGPMAVILVGAMIVAGIETVWAGQVCPGAGRREIKQQDYVNHSPPIELAAGGELGRFKLGSTVIVLFGHGSAELDSALEADSPVQMGQPLGKLVNK